MRKITQPIIFFNFLIFLIFNFFFKLRKIMQPLQILSVILSASVERVGVSRMWDFLVKFWDLSCSLYSSGENSAQSSEQLFYPGDNVQSLKYFGCTWRDTSVTPLPDEQETSGQRYIGLYLVLGKQLFLELFRICDRSHVKGDT